MTVGVVVVAANMEEALIDAGGRIAVRRIVDAAWAGGAMPIIVVVDDDALDDASSGPVSAALQGSPAQRVARRGLVGTEAYAAGARAATDAVRETSALLLWPGRMTWIDPETVTSLIEAHGRAPDRTIRPQRAGQVGWPVLLPAARIDDVLGTADAPDLEACLSTAAPDLLELGDPGSVLGREVDQDALPDYAGPPEPVGGPPPEWGAAAAETPDPEVSPAP